MPKGVLGMPLAPPPPTRRIPGMSQDLRTAPRPQHLDGPLVLWRVKHTVQVPMWAPGWREGGWPLDT